MLFKKVIVRFIAMKSSQVILIGGIALWFLFSGFQGDGVQIFDLSQLSDQYGADSVAALTKLQGALTSAIDPNTGQPLNSFQVQVLLSQALQESGLFTDNPNWNNINANNYAGINARNGMATVPGTTQNYAAYPSVSAFVTDWLNVLSHNNQPLEANSVVDFNNRLVQNAYYTANSAQYLQNLQTYYNILGGVAA